MTARELMIEAHVLKPCPMCGSGAIAQNGFMPLESVVYAYCSNLKCRLHDVEIGFSPEEWNTRAASPEMPEGISVRSYAVGETRITIEWRGEDSWAVYHCGSCLNTDGEWEYEPMPSNREDDYIARTRYPLNEAFRLAIAAGEKRAKHGVPQP